MIFLTRNSLSIKKPAAYYIDFIGPDRIVTMDKIGETPQPQAREQAKTQPRGKEPIEDSISSGSEPLPKPSVLGSAARSAAPQTDTTGKGSESASPLVADFSNFPYPWYIAQVREALWTAWTGKMPSSGSLKCTVKFEVVRSGSVTNISIEDPSGNHLFDSAAEASVGSAAPFPPLPDDFYENSLTVHVEFKTMD